MIKIYSNINEFLNNNLSNIYYEFTVDTYILKVSNDNEELIVEKGLDSELFITGSVNLIPELIDNMISLGLKFETYTMKQELALEFNKLYVKKLSGSFTELSCPIKGYVSMQYNNGNLETCVLAGGCFWCVGKPYYEYEGILKVYSGFTAGKEVLPKYEEVKQQKTHHLEAIKIIYDKTIISYEDILGIYFETIDPFDGGGQYIDRGESYTTAIFYKNDNMKNQILKYIEQVEKEYGRKIAVKLLPEMVFYMAEEYHQDYALKNPELMEEELIASGRIKK